MKDNVDFEGELLFLKKHRQLESKETHWGLQVLRSCKQILLIYMSHVQTAGEKFNNHLVTIEEKTTCKTYVL